MGYEAKYDGYRHIAAVSGRQARCSVEPVLVAQVAYAEITRDGALRQARYRGLREDKAAEVRQEQPHAAVARARRVSRR